METHYEVHMSISRVSKTGQYHAAETALVCDIEDAKMSGEMLAGMVTNLAAQVDPEPEIYV